MKESEAMKNRMMSSSGRRLRPVRLPAGTWLALLVLFVALVPASDRARAQESEFDYAAQTLRVGVWIEGLEEGDVLEKGEAFTAGFQTNEDAHAVVYHIDGQGMVTVLWPRTRYDDGFVFAGHEYLLPVTGARRLTASSEAGEGFIEAIVSKYPFDLRDLELDFHHETQTQPYAFQVAGDPFLAMNEVNYVITGLEDSGDYVVTNYMSYYVHEKVDHPRYLCSQCHFEDDVAYHPYNDSCTLEITYDYGWGNRWYDTYGYYPVYANPVYVYVDPWTWRPWVNFWYNPWYTCGPSWGWGWGFSCYTWYDSPYYWGDCYTYYGNGYRRYRPLDRTYVASDTRTKTREYSRVSGLIGEGRPTDSDRTAMRTKTSTTRDRAAVDSPTVVRTGDGRVPSVQRTTRGRTPIETGTVVQGSGGLRIRDNTQVRSATDPGRSRVRHTAGGGGTSPALKPVSRTDSRSSSGHTPLRGEKPASRYQTRKPGQSPNKPASGDRTIRPVEPHKKGTRIWNSRSGSGSTDRGRTPTVNSPSRSGRSGSTPRSEVRRPSSRSTRDNPSRSSVKAPAPKKPSSNQGKAPARVKSGSSSSSSGTKSTGGGSRNSGGSRTGGSRNSGSSRGGTNQRR
jgi:hypothetical protein